MMVSSNDFSSRGNGDYMYVYSFSLFSAFSLIFSPFFVQQEARLFFPFSPFSSFTCGNWRSVMKYGNNSTLGYSTDISANISVLTDVLSISADTNRYFGNIVLLAIMLPLYIKYRNYMGRCSLISIIIKL